MEIIVDKVTAPPPHALTRQDIKELLRLIPADWNLWLPVVHLKATLPEKSRFERPVIYSVLGGPRLNVCCRGLEPDQARREILREPALQGLGLPTRQGHRLSDSELKRLDAIIAPLLELAVAHGVQPDRD